MAVRKKKYVLNLEDDISYDLIGIVSNHSDYRLVWALNQKLGYHLEKATQEFDVFDRKTQQNFGYPMYVWEDEENKSRFTLIKNKVGSSTLIPEKPTVDYFMFITGETDMDQALTEIRSVESVLGAYIFDPSEIDSCEYFDL